MTFRQGEGCLLEVACFRLHTTVLPSTPPIKFQKLSPVQVSCLLFLSSTIHNNWPSICLSSSLPSLLFYPSPSSSSFLPLSGEVHFSAFSTGRWQAASKSLCLPSPGPVWGAMSQFNGQVGEGGSSLSSLLLSSGNVNV